MKYHSGVSQDNKAPVGALVVQPQQRSTKITELRKDLGYIRRHLGHMFTLTEQAEQPDLRQQLLDDYRQMRESLNAVGARITSLEGSDHGA